MTPKTIARELRAVCEHDRRLGLNPPTHANLLVLLDAFDEAERALADILENEMIDPALELMRVQEVARAALAKVRS